MTALSACTMSQSQSRSLWRRRWWCTTWSSRSPHSGRQGRKTDVSDTSSRQSMVRANIERLPGHLHRRPDVHAVRMTKLLQTALDDGCGPALVEGFGNGSKNG